MIQLGWGRRIVPRRSSLPLSSSADELLVPFPYDAICNYWLQAMIALENGEGTKYITQMQLFNALHKDYA